MAKKRKHRKQTDCDDILNDPYPDMNGDFAYIAGYTPGGAPYGVTWEEEGIDSNLPFEEKVRLYRKKIENEQKENAFDDLPF